MKNSTLALALLATAAACTTPSHAAVIFSTLGPGGTFSFLRYGADGSAAYQAFLFQPTAAGTLDTLTVAIAHEAPPSSDTRFLLYSGTSTTLGTLLESFTAPNNSTTGALVTLNSIAHPNLAPTSFYWLALSEATPSDTNDSYWYFSNTSTFTFRITPSLFGSALIPAFELNSANPVEVDTPEPATSLTVSLALLALGAAAARARLRSR